MTRRKNVVGFISKAKRGRRCAGCGRTRSEVGSPLHFHHIRPEEKLFEIARSHGRSVEEVQTEMEKCILLCKACHRRMHSHEGFEIAVIHNVGGYAYLDVISSP